MNEQSLGGMRVDELSMADLTAQRFIQDYRNRGKPVVITDFIKPSVDWDLNFLCGHLGDDEYLVRHYGEGHFAKPRHLWTKYCDHLMMTMTAFAACIQDGSAKIKHLYLAQSPIGHTEAAKSIATELSFLTRDLGLEPAIRGATLNVWVGPAGHAEPLHFDPGDGTLIQLHGSKKVILFPPEQTAYLYPFGFYDTLPFWVSQVNIDNPDLDKHPDYSKAKQHRYELVLNPGQLLYIPTHWWHEVIALGDGYVCSCNHFWKVRPFWRNFNSSRSIVMLLMNRLPWHWVLRFNRFIFKLKKLLSGNRA
ncbi:MAG: cupin-like domain-containing protein [Methylovulum sp.]|nr:cupin-like domain-containing protein [Methylovulum sp.]